MTVGRATHSMPAAIARRVRQIPLRVPVIALVLAFTAVPAEVRPVDAGLIFRAFDLNLDVADVIANVVGYIPIGAVLAEKGWMGLVSAAGISFLAEASQLFAKGRSPSVIDLATNIIGAAIGIAICARWKPTATRLTVNAGVAAVALALAVLTSLALITGMTPNHLQNLIRLTLVARPWQPSNDRGASVPGTLEARWTFDDVRGDTVLDESGQGLRGRLVNRPSLVAGIEGQALSLNGRNQWLNVGNPPALRLTGSMTITAWINAATFAEDDAAIVSNYNGLGYQLDTSEDEGRHTVGFKLANTFGTVMARFGRTPLEPHR